MAFEFRKTAPIDAILDQIGEVGAMPKCAKLFRLASAVWLLSLGNALTARAAEFHLNCRLPGYSPFNVTVSVTNSA